MGWLRNFGIVSRSVKIFICYIKTDIVYVHISISAVHDMLPIIILETQSETAAY